MKQIIYSEPLCQACGHAVNDHGLDRTGRPICYGCPNAVPCSAMKPMPLEEAVEFMTMDELDRAYAVNAYFSDWNKCAVIDLERERRKSGQATAL